MRGCFRSSPIRKGVGRGGVCVCQTRPDMKNGGPLFGTLIRQLQLLFWPTGDPQAHGAPSGYTVQAPAQETGVPVYQ